MGKLVKGRNDEGFLELSFTEFLDLVKVLKMLYGREIAERVFTENLSRVYNINNASFLKKRQG